MFRETRSAVETAGIAFLISRDPKALEIYLEDDGRAKERKAAKDAFRRNRLFPDAEPVMKMLGEEYDSASHRAHSNVLSFFSHMPNLKSGTGNIEITVQDIHKESAPQMLPLHIFWLVHTHLELLTAIRVIFPQLPDTPDVTAFFNEWHYAFSK